MDLRNFWKHEATDFTPWLAKEENIQLLSETIGCQYRREIETKGKGKVKMYFAEKSI